jgi:hypothetical protein
LNRVRIPGASALALWSYAGYLVHEPVFMALRPQLERLHVDAGALDGRRAAGPAGSPVRGISSGMPARRLLRAALRHGRCERQRMKRRHFDTKYLCSSTC